jgi:aspartate aminotransferase-like enzyme
MLGPNVKPNIHHREKQFELLYDDLCNAFKDKFNLPEDIIVLPITGSGTLALEILINSLDIKFKHEFTDEEFGSRLEKINHQEKGNEGTAYVHYETSISKLNSIEKSNGITLLDAVSSFPYYDIPSNVDAWVTVNSKQLGCNPGLSFIIIKKSLLSKVKPVEFSYLSLQRYLDYGMLNQTPNTPAISLMQETLEKIQTFDIDAFRKKIDKRRKQMHKVFDTNTGDGPVYTIEDNSYNDIKNVFGLYGKKNIQIFLWSGTDKDYNSLVNYTKKENK